MNVDRDFSNMSVEKNVSDALREIFDMYLVVHDKNAHIKINKMNLFIIDQLKLKISLNSFLSRIFLSVFTKSGAS